MMIRHIIGEGVVLAFPKSEKSVVLAILRVLYNANKQDFLQEAIQAIEAEDAPKTLQLVNYFHLCSKCFRDIDQRDENAICITKDGDTKWKHKICVPLKDNRPT